MGGMGIEINLLTVNGLSRAGHFVDKSMPCWLKIGTSMSVLPLRVGLNPRAASNFDMVRFKERLVISTYSEPFGMVNIFAGGCCVAHDASITCSATDRLDRISLLWGCLFVVDLSVR